MKVNCFYSCVELMSVQLVAIESPATFNLGILKICIYSQDMYIFLGNMVCIIAGYYSLLAILCII